MHTRTRLPMLVLMALLSTACGPIVEDSTEFSTDEMNASFDVSVIDGGAFVSASLTSTEEDWLGRTTALALDGEQIFAEFNGIAWPLSSSDDSTDSTDDNSASFDDDSDPWRAPVTSVLVFVPGVVVGDEVRVSLVRAGVAHRSSVEVPDATMSGLQAGATFSRSTDDIVVSYVPLSDGSLMFSGDCIESLAVESTSFSAWPLFGRFASTTVVRGTLQQRADATSTTCPMVVTQSRRASGELSHAFAGGSITAEHTDRIDVVSSP